MGFFILTDMEYSSKDLSEIFFNVRSEIYKALSEEIHPCDMIRISHMLENQFYKQKNHNDTELIDRICDSSKFKDNE